MKDSVWTSLHVDIHVDIDNAEAVQPSVSR